MTISNSGMIKAHSIGLSLVITIPRSHDCAAAGPVCRRYEYNNCYILMQIKKDNYSLFVTNTQRYVSSGVKILRPFFISNLLISIAS